MRIKLRTRSITITSCRHRHKFSSFPPLCNTQLPWIAELQFSAGSELQISFPSHFAGLGRAIARQREYERNWVSRSCVNGLGATVFRRHKNMQEGRAVQWGSSTSVGTAWRRDPAIASQARLWLAPLPGQWKFSDPYCCGSDTLSSVDLWSSVTIVRTEGSEIPKLHLLARDEIANKEQIVLFGEYCTRRIQKIENYLNKRIWLHLCVRLTQF